MRKLNVQTHIWPVAGTFRISRSALTQIFVVQVSISEGEYTGRGECRPYARYDETPESVTAQIETIRSLLETDLTIENLQSALSPGAARNAVDCALWDLKAKQAGKRVWELLGLAEPAPRITAYTLSLDTPEAMADTAIKAKQYNLLKMKVGGTQSQDCIDAVMKARTDANLIIDANEAMTPDEVTEFRTHLLGSKAVLIEQPLPAASNSRFDPGILPPICADESLHTCRDLDLLWESGYRAVNVKLDKCGGLTEGLALMKAAKEKGFTIMAGCMVSSSLAMAPMMMLESFADFIDLDGPLLLADDVADGLKYDGQYIHPPSRELWG
ncbi:MAG: N-acetyl-D-Glu racemase DgcA [Alphaproteobacteria bacterium]